jgi:hypothetical protein
LRWLSVSLGTIITVLFYRTSGLCATAQSHPVPSSIALPKCREQGSIWRRLTSGGLVSHCGEAGHRNRHPWIRGACFLLLAQFASSLAFHASNISTRSRLILRSAGRYGVEDRAIIDTADVLLLHATIFGPEHNICGKPYQTVSPLVAKLFRPVNP